MLIKTLGPQIKRTHERRIGAVEPVLQRCCTIQVLLPVRVIQAAVICADHKHKLCGFLAVYRAGGLVGAAVIGQDRVAVHINDGCDGWIFCQRVLNHGKRAVIRAGVHGRIENFADMYGLNAVVLEDLLQLVTDAHYIIIGIGRALGLGRCIRKSGIRRVAFAAVCVIDKHLRPISISGKMLVCGQTVCRIHVIRGLVVDGDRGSLVSGRQHRIVVLGVGRGHIGALCKRIFRLLIPRCGSRARRIHLGGILRRNAELERHCAGDKAAVASQTGQCLLCDRFAACPGKNQQRQRQTEGDGGRQADAASRSEFLMFTPLHCAILLAVSCYLSYAVQRASMPETCHERYRSISATLRCGCSAMLTA